MCLYQSYNKNAHPLYHFKGTYEVTCVIHRVAALSYLLSATVTSCVIEAIFFLVKWLSFSIT